MSESQGRPRLQIVVVTYSPGKAVDDFLDSVSGAWSEPVAVTVVDNGSRDGTVERLSTRRDLEVVVASSNIGYGSAANLGVAQCSEPWILVANPDVVLGEGALDELVAVAQRWPSGGAFGPRIHTQDGLLYPSARELPSLGRGIAHAALGWIWAGNPWTAAYRRERGRPIEENVGWLSGACLLLRREAFAQVDGFDEGYFMYFEDTDLCERMGRAGWDVVYAPSAIVVHQGGQATSQHLAAMSRAHHDSAYRYLSRRYDGPRWAPLRAVIRLGLWGRYHLSRRVTRVTHGAQPTRRAN